MDTTYGADYQSLYARHWWWRSRERILRCEIASLDLPADAQILDVGCGNGLFMATLQEFGDVYGIEIDDSLLTDDNPYRERISTRTLEQGAHAGRTFQLVTACDVIEHIEDDAAAVRDMVDTLAVGGHLLITVPAFSALWDQHDEINHHFRRYHKRQLTRLLERLPLRLVTCRYLFHAIFLPKLAVTAWNSRLRSQKISQHQLPPAWLNRTMQTLCYSEYQLTRALASPPFGTSVLAIAERTAT